jgi:hypothetical protein
MSILNKFITLGVISPPFFANFAPPPPVVISEFLRCVGGC